MSLIGDSPPGSFVGPSAVRASPRAPRLTARSICDLQEKFRGPIHEFQKVVDTTKKLLKASQNPRHSRLRDDAAAQQARRYLPGTRTRCGRRRPNQSSCGQVGVLHVRARGTAGVPRARSGEEGGRDRRHRDAHLRHADHAGSAARGAQSVRDRGRRVELQPAGDRDRVGAAARGGRGGHEQREFPVRVHG
nr:hypothetical protein CFP56_53264 [Quercus suber]